jgi:uncharacterized Zn finger protein (UPF0148 family)
VTVLKEYVRCSNCGKPVVKQKFCPRCGNILIEDPESPPAEGEKVMDDKTSENPVEANPTEQLEKLSQKVQSSEDERRANIEEESETVGKEDLGTVDKEGVKVVTFASDEGTSLVNASVVATMETVPNVTKNVKDVSDLVNLLKGDEIGEDAFAHAVDDTHKLILRRGELIAEMEAAVKGYRSTMISVRQNMKLLNIRARAAALRRDIDDYMRGTGGEQEAAHLGSLGGLNDSEELEKLMSAVNLCSDALSELRVSDDVKGKIQNSMEEALSLLRETSGSR